MLMSAEWWAGALSALIVVAAICGANILWRRMRK